MGGRRTLLGLIKQDKKARGANGFTTMSSLSFFNLVGSDTMVALSSQGSQDHLSMVLSLHASLSLASPEGTGGWVMIVSWPCHTLLLSCAVCAPMP